MAKTRTSGQGRPKNVPNKMTRDLKLMIEGALDDVGGQRYLAEQANVNPAAFMSLLGKVLPRDLNLTANAGAEMLAAMMEISKRHEPSG